MILTVSELTKNIKLTLEENFSQISVLGEISNFKPHISGHWYFNLKDSDAVISCTMWRGFNNYVFFTPQDGMKVIVNGKLTVYPPRGNYQIDIRSMKPAGEGELMAAFEILKQKLAVEGLFNDEFKKPIPVYAKKIGIVSAIDGAALRDMISVAKRRFPLVELVITPASVQGNKAAESVAYCIRLLNQQSDIDLIIIARGGGTIEDLWAFNEEIVAREIFNSRIPIITGIGHEIDFTIADFVADLRAPTPSAAMELATPNRDDLFAFISDFSYNSTQNIIALCKNNKGKVLNTLSSYGFRIPFDLVRRLSQRTDGLLNKLLQNIDRNLLVKNNKVSLLTRTVESHNIQKTLRKGFVLVHQDSKLIPRAKNFNPEKNFSLKFFDKEVEFKLKK